MSVKLTDIVKKFTGDKNVDIVQWLKKLELVAKLQKVDDLASFIPLFLEEDAFSIYDQLDDAKKTDFKEIAAALKSSFSLTPFQAFEEFKHRCLKEGESPDAFMADLRRLSSLFEVEDDNLVACQFVAGMPEDVAAQLKALKQGSRDTKQLLECAKQLLREVKEVHGSGLGAAGRQLRTGGNSGTNPRNRGSQQGWQRREKCSGCFRFGHNQKECQTKCYGCGNRGHLERNCPNGSSGNSGFQEPPAVQPGNVSGNGTGGVPPAGTGASLPPLGYQE